MVGIVEADADELAGAGNAGADARLAGDQRQAFGIDLRQRGQRIRIELRAGDIEHMARQVADRARGIDHARPLAADFTITNKFHVSLPLIADQIVQPPSIA